MHTEYVIHSILYYSRGISLLCLILFFVSDDPLSFLISLVICTSTDKPIGPFPNVINGKFHDLARPYLADVNVDCHIKMAAYDFAKKIQPERGEHRAVFDALQLQQCNMERPGEDKPLEIPDIEDPGFSVFVDIHQGDDQNSGSIRDPVKTIERGIALTRGV